MSHGHISSKSNILMSQIIYQDQREKYFVVMTWFYLYSDWNQLVPKSAKLRFFIELSHHILLTRDIKISRIFIQKVWLKIIKFKRDLKQYFNLKES